ncbi:MAG: response regulator transcription factor [Planctomycetota bacterium]|jgi:FixJ family two-component response regulator
MSEVEPVVYIVDDDEAVRDGLGKLMESIHLKVETFASAQEFLDSYDVPGPGCLLLDVRMPGMSGVKLQDTLAERNIMLPIIFISGHGDLPMAVEAVKKGAVDFIEKPVGDQVLLDRVQEALAKDAQIREQQAERQIVLDRLELLTNRERQVLDLMREGKPSKTIAFELELSRKTVEVHRAHVMGKMNAESLAELMALVGKID